MIATALKHYLYDIAIGQFFDAIGNNFAATTMSYVGGYWLAVNADNTIIAYGKCIEQNGNLIVLEDGEIEYVVHSDLFEIQPISKSELDHLLRIFADDT